MRKGGLAFIFVTVLIDFLGYGMLIPVLPKFIGVLSHQDQSGSARDFGLLLGIYGLMQFLFAPVLGNLSDRFGRRPVLLFSLFFNGLNYLIISHASSMASLYTGITMSGIAGATFGTASSYIADVSAPEDRPVNFGIIGAAFGLGFIVGPLVGGTLGLIGIRIPFEAAAGLALLNVIYGFFVLPESLKKENRRPFSINSANPIRALKILKRYAIVWAMVPSLIASYLADKFVQSTWVLFMSYRFNWNTAETGFSLTAIGLLCVIFQIGLGRFIIPRLGERRVILVGIASAIFEIVAITLIPKARDYMVYVIMVLAGMNFLSAQSTQGVLSAQVEDDQQGALMGRFSLRGCLRSRRGRIAITHFLVHRFLPPP
jgi:DHA1 family tetracycline resistance protein-like MFS transporter